MLWDKQKQSWPDTFSAASSSGSEVVGGRPTFHIHDAELDAIGEQEHLQQRASMSGTTKVSSCSPTPGSLVVADEQVRTGQARDAVDGARFLDFTAILELVAEADELDGLSVDPDQLRRRIGAAHWPTCRAGQSRWRDTVGGRAQRQRPRPLPTGAVRARRGGHDNIPPGAADAPRPVAGPFAHFDDAVWRGSGRTRESGTVGARRTATRVLRPTDDRRVAVTINGRCMIILCSVSRSMT